MNGPDIVVLRGGEVLLRGQSVLDAYFAMQAALDAQRRNQLPVRRSVQQLADALLAAANLHQVAEDPGSAEVPLEPAMPPSGQDDSIDVKEAAVLLHCTSRNVRDLCCRGQIESARRVAGRWVMDRAEILGRTTRSAV